MAVAVAENVDRKDFTKSERIKMAKRLTDVIGDRRKLKPGKGKVAERPLIEVPKGTKTRDSVAKWAGFDSSQEMRRAELIQKRGCGALVKMVDDNKVSVSAAAEIVSALSKSEQVDLVSEGARAVRDMASKLREKQRPAEVTDEYVIARDNTIVPIDVQVRFADPTSKKRYVSIDADYLWKTLTANFGYLSLQPGETRQVHLSDKDGYRVMLNCELMEADAKSVSFVAPGQEIRIHDP